MQKQVQHLTTASIKQVLSDHGMTHAQGLTMLRLIREYPNDKPQGVGFYLCWAAQEIPSPQLPEWAPYKTHETNYFVIRELLTLDGKKLNGMWTGGTKEKGSTLQGKAVRLQWLAEVIALLKAKPRNTAGDYKPTIDIGAFTRYPEDFRTLRPGQWVAYPEFSPPIRGQFLGITKHGNVIVNWVSGVGMVKQFSSNHQLREYAKIHK